MDKPKNILMKVYPETIKKTMILDVNNLFKLSPEEFWLHTFLMNQDDEFEPTMRALADIMGIGVTKVHALTKKLRMKGFIDLLPTEDGRSFVWAVNSVPIDVKRHTEFLNTRTPTLEKRREERNLPINVKIAELKRALDMGIGDRIAIIEEIERLERSKV